MAQRPVFLVSEDNIDNKIMVEFEYCPGFSIQQKQKSFKNIHNSFKKNYPTLNILEISSKSDNDLGVKLSAFNLKLNIGENKLVSIESVFQASKVFENGGPYTDIIEKSSIEAKKDIRIRESGEIISFSLRGKKYPTEPKTLFYNWIYMHALYQKHNKELFNEVIKYDAFSDIEFNPKKSLNCQAESCAMFVSLYRRNRLLEALHSMEVFEKELYYNDMLF